MYEYDQAITFPMIGIGVCDSILNKILFSCKKNNILFYI